MEGDAEVVTADVDLLNFSYRGVTPFEKPIVLTARACNRAGVVTLDCAYRYTLCLVCDRCLAPFTQEVDHTISHTVVRALNTSEDDDYVVAPDGIVELTELATNDVILSLPGKFLCRDDCKGLCPACGCDLNQVSCICARKEPDPRLAALDKFFED